MSEVMKPTVPVFVFMLDERDQVYLQRRYQTGYLDGYYDPPAGKMDEGEYPKKSACRELNEEAGVIVKPDDLELFHSYMNLSNNDPWLGLMFRTRNWQGKPSIREPHKCDNAAFFNLNELPNVTPQVRDGLSRIMVASTIEISEYNNIDSQ